MLICAAVCPHPPALIEDLSGRGAARLDDLRAACIDVVRRLGEAAADLVVCVGAGPEERRWPADAAGSLREFGAELTIGSGRPGLPGETGLPLSLTVGRYLLDRAGVPAGDFQAVGSQASPQRCRRLGARLAAESDHVALLVLGDGSAKLTTQSPGYADGRAKGFDDEAFAALAVADIDGLMAIDPVLADQLWVAGRPAWQVLAGALAGSAGNWRGELTHRSAPLGVGYATVLVTRVR